MKEGDRRAPPGNEVGRGRRREGGTKEKGGGEGEGPEGDKKNHGGERRRTSNE